MTTRATMDEIELVYQLQQDSQKAFNRIYEIYSARLYAYCMQYVKSREDSEEIVQDVFIKLWTNRHSIVHAELLSNFIFKIAKNQIINRYRSRLNSFVFEEYVNYYNEVACSVNDASDIVEYDDFCQSLKKAMKSLPNTQREVIESMRFNQLSVKETAQSLNLNEQTVKNALSAGLKTLKEILKRSMILIFLFIR